MNYKNKIKVLLSASISVVIFSNLNFDEIDIDFSFSPITSYASNVVKGKVLEINLDVKEEFPETYRDNPDGYETLIVTTTGGKKIDWQDYTRISASKIPNIDLSGSQSGGVSSRSFLDNDVITSIKFPQGIEYIGEEAFYNCVNLTSMSEFPDTLRRIDRYAFRKCNNITGELILPESLESIGDSAFAYCYKLTGDLILPDSITTLGSSVFDSCNGFNGILKISNRLREIPYGVFAGCNNLIGDIIIPDSIERVNNQAFNGCSKFNGKIVLGKNLKSVGQYSFNRLASVVGPIEFSSSLVEIGDGAFEGMSSYEGDIIIPNTVQKILGYAFHGSSAERIIVRVSDSDSKSNYREAVIRPLLDLSELRIETNNTFDISKTWLANETVRTYSPNVKDASNPDGEDVTIAENVILNIPTPYKLSSLTVMKNGEPYPLPENELSNVEKDGLVRFGKYTFNEIGNYTVNIETHLGSVSELNFKVGVMDEVPPVVELTIDTEDWAREKTITVRVNDDKSGVKGIRLPDGNFIASSETTYKVFENKEYAFIGYDKNLNEAQSTIVVSKIDRVNPEFTTEIVNEDGINYIYVNSNNDDSGIQKIVIDGEEFLKSDHKYKIKRNGTHNISVYDNVSNIKESSLDIDVNLLSLNLKPSTTDFTNKDVIINITVEGPIEDFDYILLSNDNKVYESEINFPVSNNGYYESIVVSKSGKMSISGIHVNNIDKKRPSVQISKNPDTEWSNTDVDITITGEDI